MYDVVPRERGRREEGRACNPWNELLHYYYILFYYTFYIFFIIIILLCVVIKGRRNPVANQIDAIPSLSGIPMLTSRWFSNVIIRV